MDDVVVVVSRQRMLRTLVAIASASMLSASLGACGQYEAETTIAPPQIAGNDEPLRISTATDEYEEILPALYDQAFRSTNAGRKQDRDAVVAKPVGADDALAAINTGQSDVTLVCSGTLLAALNPKEARRIAEKYDKKYDKQAKTRQTDTPDNNAAAKANEDTSQPESDEVNRLTDPELIGETYASLVAQLPATMAASDPSPVHGCEIDPDLSLPTNVVPVYRKTLINVDDRQVLNWVSGAVNDGTMTSLQKKLHSEHPVSSVRQDGTVGVAAKAESTAESYLRQHGLVLK